MRSPRALDHRLRPISVPVLVVRFALAGLVVMVLLGTLLTVLTRQAGTQQAIDSARQVAWVTARGIVEPQLSDQLLDGDPAAQARFDQAVRRYALQNSLVRVKIWNADGRIVYSDEPRLIGQSFPLGEEEQEALEDQQTDSEISDLSRPENAHERSFDKLLEVYVGITSPRGDRLLFESYFRYDAVATAARAQWRKYAPPTLAGLLALELVQIPFAWSLARRLQRQQRDRQRLLQQAVDASDAERRRIAADLHDGVVQELTGLTYGLDAARLRTGDHPDQREVISTTAGRLRGTVSQLRSLLIDIYPPSLSEGGLPAALAELASGLEREGLSVEVDVNEAAGVPLEVSTVLFRSAQELLRNVAAHSRATRVQLTAGADADSATLVVDDDGVGFEQTEANRRFTEGHIGLRSAGDLVADFGGTMQVRSATGQGTRAEITVPL